VKVGNVRVTRELLQRYGWNTIIVIIVLGFTGRVGVGGFLEIEKTPESRFPKKKEQGRPHCFSSLFRKQLRLFNETSGVNLAYI
jgi:hypothetical protein